MLERGLSGRQDGADNLDAVFVGLEVRGRREAANSIHLGVFFLVQGLFAGTNPPHKYYKILEDISKVVRDALTCRAVPRRARV